jgi:hypothetical protein
MDPVRYQPLNGDAARHADGPAVDSETARLPTADTRARPESDTMIEEQVRPPPGKLPSVEDAAADIRRLTAALQARRQAAPDNLVELAALNVDLQRASAVWRRLVPTGVWG